MNAANRQRSRCGFVATRRALAFIAIVVCAPAPAAIVTVGASGCDHTDLGAAIAAAQPGDELRLRAQTFSVSTVVIDKSLELRGGFAVCGDATPGLGLTSTLAGDVSDSVVRVSGLSTHVQLTSLVLTGGGDTNRGGGLEVFLAATVRLSTVTIEGNSADFGGGIYVGPSARLEHGGPLVVRDNAAVDGGGIYASESAVLDFTTSGFNTIDIVSNAALDEGGGIYLRDEGELLTDANRPFTIDANQADFGGGIFAETAAVIDARRVAITNNTADADGGGVYVAGDDQPASAAAIGFDGDSRIEANRAVRGGGVALGAGAGYILRLGGEILSNEATSDGGGVWHAGGGLLAADRVAVLRDNQAGGDGGCLFQQAGTSEIATLSCIGNRAAIDGGGAFVTDGGVLDVVGQAAFDGNRAGANGGGIALDLGSSLFTGGGGQNNLLVQNNVAETGDGGGLFVLRAGLSVRGVVLGGEGSGNSAPQGNGGGAYLDSDFFWTMYNTRVIDNSAGGEGGGLYVTGGGGFEFAGLPDEDSVPSRGGFTDCDAAALDANRYCAEIRGNSSVGAGGGLHVQNASATRTELRNTAVVANRGGAPAAGVYVDTPELELENTLVARHAEHSAVFVLFEGGLSLDHTSVLYNDFGVIGGGGETMRISRSLFWGNGDDLLPGVGASVTGECNLSTELRVPDRLPQRPRFIATTRGEYRLSDQSPAVDACASSPFSRDLDGYSRPAGVGYDIGAFEGAWGTSDVLLSDGFEVGPLASPLP